MKTYTKQLFRVDQIWYDNHDRKFYGDLAATFQDADDTISDSIEDTTAGIREGLRALIGEGTDNLYPTTQVRVLVLQTTTATLELEDNDSPEDFRPSDYTAHDWRNIVLFPACTATWANIIHMKTDLPTEYLNI